MFDPPKKVFVTAFRDNRSLWMAQDILRRCPPKQFVLAQTAAQADIILYVEEGYLGLTDLPLVVETVALAPHAAHYVFSECDWPFPFLPGAYPSLSRRCRSGRGWSFLPKHGLMEASLSCAPRRPSYLYSFLGRKETHKVRSAILALDGPETPCVDLADAPVRFPNFDYGRTYLDLIADSKFVLCPRGYGTSSFRIFEAMALGRVPVIISDKWQQPPGIAWDGISLFVSERDIATIPSLLSAYEEKAEDMGERAARIYAEHFAPEVFFDRLLVSLSQSYAGAAFDRRSILTRARQTLGWREIWSLGSQMKATLIETMRKHPLRNRKQVRL